MDVFGFDWDDGNWPKCGKHGVTKGEIESLFLGSPAVQSDPNHSLEEQRLRAIGKTSDGRFLLVVFTLRDKTSGHHIRPISARYMHAKEITHYEIDS